MSAARAAGKAGPAARNEAAPAARLGGLLDALAVSLAALLALAVGESSVVAHGRVLSLGPAG